MTMPNHLTMTEMYSNDGSSLDAFYNSLSMKITSSPVISDGGGSIEDLKRVDRNWVILMTCLTLIIRSTSLRVPISILQLWQSDSDGSKGLLGAAMMEEFSCN